MENSSEHLKKTNLIFMSEKEPPEPTRRVLAFDPAKESFSRIQHVEKRFRTSRSKIYADIAAGLFPKPHHPYGSRISVWLNSELDQHMEKLLRTTGKEMIA